MTFDSIGDLSQSFLLRRQSAALKAKMIDAQTELTTGLASSTRKHLGGNYSHLADIERNLSVLEAYRATTNEAASATNVMQTALGHVQDKTSDLAASLLVASQIGSENTLDQVSNDAQQAFHTVVSQLNTRVADRTLFAGSTTNGAALATGTIILSDLRAHLSGETTLAGVESTLDDWFDTPGGGFETQSYLGGDQNLAAFKLADDTQVSFSLRADAQVVRDVLKSTAMAALAADSSLGFSHSLKSALIESAGSKLLTLGGDLTDARAELGLAQETIEDSSARNEAAGTALQIARNELLGIDQFDAATELEQAQSQIEMLYAVTVRASRLSLLDFMR